MPFFGKKFSKRTSLFQKNKIDISGMYSIFYPDCYSQRRVSLFNGSITVEAALILPIFLFAMLSILMFCEGIRLSNNITVLLHQNAKELSMYGYASKYMSEGGVGKVGSGVFCEVYVKSRVQKGLKNKKQSVNDICGGNMGIHYLQSEILKDDVIDLVASYEVQLPYSFLGAGKFKVIDRARVRAWTGYDNTRTQYVGKDEEIVFVTKDSEIYHRDRGCRHLNVKIKAVKRQELPNIRNQSGGKYYDCGFCKGELSTVVYLTEYGDRYHESITCSKLKRDVYPVPLSKAANRRPCKTCGK